MKFKVPMDKSGAVLCKLYVQDDNERLLYEDKIHIDKLKRPSGGVYD